ncbi:MAG: hypothetical protein ACKOXP_02265 [Flavobacteriales bacterium]
MKTAFVSFFIFCCSFSFGQTNLSNGARSLSLSNASVTLTDVWAQLNNPAALIGLTKFNVGVSYQNRFGLKELQSQAIVMALPVKKMVLSGGSQFYGYQQYRSMKSGIGVSLSLSDKVSMGVKLNHHYLRFNENYGSASNLSADLGLLVKFTNRLYFGCSALNIGRSKVSANINERLPSALRLGLRYQISNQLSVLSELEKNVIYPLQVKCAAEYQPSSHWYFRGGIATAPLSFSFGFGGKFKDHYSLDIGTAFHQLLGWSPHVSMQLDLP